MINNRDNSLINGRPALWLTLSYLLRIVSYTKTECLVFPDLMLSQDFYVTKDVTIPKVTILGFEAETRKKLYSTYNIVLS